MTDAHSTRNAPAFASSTALTAKRLTWTHPAFVVSVMSTLLMLSDACKRKQRRAALLRMSGLEDVSRA